jgi:Tol biopolymer transport system component
MNLRSSCLLAAAFACVAGSALAQRASTLRVNLSSNGDECNGDTAWYSISADGMHVAFSSFANNLVAGDVNGRDDVFVHDRITGRTVLASVSSAGVQGNWDSFQCSLSADGTIVVFSSAASTLVPNDQNAATDVFVRYLLRGTTERASVDSAGGEGTYGGGFPAISGDGQRVVFASDSYFGPGSSFYRDIYVRDLLAGTTTCASVGWAGASADGDSCGLLIGPSISGDGRYVVFESDATNLVLGDTNGASDVFVRDLQAGATTRVSLGGGGVQGNAGSYIGKLAWDGRWVTFMSDASNLVAQDTNGFGDLFVRDLASGVTERVNVSSAGAQTDNFSEGGAVSDDGRYVVFSSWAGGLVGGDTNADWDVFVRDRWLGLTERVSVDNAGAQAVGYGYEMSRDGRTVLFGCWLPAITPGDTNGRGDIYVRDRLGCVPTVATFCTAGISSSGCTASISATGVPMARARGGFAILVGSTDPLRSAMILYGVSGSQAQVVGNGFSCIKPPRQRTGMQFTRGAGTCGGTLALDWNAWTDASGSLGEPFTGGETVWAQAWIRDPASPTGASMSDALWFDVAP